MDILKYSKYFKIFVVLALITSLGMKVAMVSRLNQIESQVTSISNTQHNILSNVDGQTSHIQSVLNDMKEEQSWISSINMDVNPTNLEEGQLEVTFEWQVKELHSDSEVIFNYVYGDSKEYIEIPAEEIQQGLFQVKIPVEVEMEPQWEIGMISGPSNGERELSKQEIEKSLDEEERERILTYFVSVSHDETVKSGELHSENLGYYGTNYYGIIQTDIHLNDSLSVMLAYHQVTESSPIVEEAYLLKYNNGSLVGEEEIKSEKQHNLHDDRFGMFHLDGVEDYDDMQLVIKVVYRNGSVFEKEVY